MAFSAMVLASVISCRKDGTLTVKEEEKAVATQARAIVQARLEKIAKKVALLATNKKAVKIIEQNVAARFDGDKNVLTKDLFEPRIGNKKRLLPQSLASLPKLNALFANNSVMSDEEPNEPPTDEPPFIKF